MPSAKGSAIEDRYMHHDAIGHIAIVIGIASQCQGAAQSIPKIGVPSVEIILAVLVLKGYSPRATIPTGGFATSVKAIDAQTDANVVESIGGTGTDHLFVSRRVIDVMVRVYRSPSIVAE